VKEGLEEAVPGIIVTVNPDKVVNLLLQMYIFVIDACCL